MLLSKTATMYWNSRNKNRFVNLGYTFTKMFEPFDVKVDDLSIGSNAIVVVKCDFCGKEKECTYNRYLVSRKLSQIDSCSNPECEYKKAKMSMESIYGTHNVRSVDYIEARRKRTIIAKYGVDNPFSNDDIKKKIRETNIQKYGSPCTMQNKEVREKAKATCMEKYGVESYIDFLHDNKREKSPCWKGGKKITPRNRQDYFYKVWRTGVFERDNYTCQKCGRRSKSGNPLALVGHHILNWKTNEELRYDINNGITFCEDCHREFHKDYGFRDNTLEQVRCFICKNEKIC